MQHMLVQPHIIWRVILRRLSKIMSGCVFVCTPVWWVNLMHWACVLGERMCVCVERLEEYVYVCTYVDACMCAVRVVCIWEIIDDTEIEQFLLLIGSHWFTQNKGIEKWYQKTYGKPTFPYKYVCLLHLDFILILLVLHFSNIFCCHAFICVYFSGNEFFLSINVCSWVWTEQ